MQVVRHAPCWERQQLTCAAPSQPRLVMPHLPASAQWPWEASALRPVAMGFFSLYPAPLSLPRWARDSRLAHEAGDGGGWQAASWLCLFEELFPSLNTIEMKDLSGALAAQQHLQRRHEYEFPPSMNAKRPP